MYLDYEWHRFDNSTVKRFNNTIQISKTLTPRNQKKAAPLPETAFFLF
ncbi:hypothetical protein ADIS_3617 [Lunatimonas lonarensis]|uniref:Uncharacterized protein n=1 Tax=Lunatimonas lonarensis TaxID=1232681 RepID=R7ZPB0_9BACT|nr:hypothetical protein ADIS_3617 [Lunatimonas lonarensis]